MSYFNPRSPHGERQTGSGRNFGISNFNPRSPHGERLAARRKGKRQRGISIHAPRMGSDPQTTAPSDTGFISIHAPRMGSDLSDRSRENKMSISIHAPRMGSDSTRFKSNIANAVFQSTLPAWGATAHVLLSRKLHVLFQSTLPAWGATVLSSLTVASVIHFNPRSPHGERLTNGMKTKRPKTFQSTLPAWGATESVDE